MKFFNLVRRRWTRAFHPQFTRAQRLRVRGLRPGFECLEDRSLLSVSAWSVTGVTVFENSGEAQFTVSCHAIEPVTVEYRTVAGSAAEGSDYTAVSGTLSFEVGNSPVTVAVPIVDDLFTEEDEAFWLELFNPTNSTIEIGQAAATIRLNDHAPQLEAISDQTVEEYQDLQLFAFAEDVDEPAETLTYSLDVGAPNGAVIDSYSGLVGWMPDELHGGGIFQITVRVTDSGTPNRSSTQTFSVTVLEVNSEPLTSGIGDVTVEEDADDTVISLWSSFADAEDGPSGLSYSVVNNSDSTLFSSVTIDSSGQLRLEYALNAWGFSTITVRAIDSGGLSVETSFLVTVIAVNDPPKLTAFSIAYDNVFSGWVISGSATDVDDDLTDTAISFGGLLAGYNLTVMLNANGSFSAIAELAGIGNGNVSAWVNDAQGAQSNVIVTSV